MYLIESAPQATAAATGAAALIDDPAVLAVGNSRLQQEVAAQLDKQCALRALRQLQRMTSRQHMIVCLPMLISRFGACVLFVLCHVFGWVRLFRHPCRAGCVVLHCVDFGANRFALFADLIGQVLSQSAAASQNVGGRVVEAMDLLQFIEIRCLIADAFFHCLSNVNNVILKWQINDFLDILKKFT